MSVYVLSSRLSSVECNVDELGRKADSFNTVLSGTTTINGLAFLNGPVALGSRITGIDISDVAGLQTALNLNAPLASPILIGTKSDITKAMVGLGNVDNIAELHKPIATATDGTSRCSIAINQGRHYGINMHRHSTWHHQVHGWSWQRR